MNERNKGKFLMVNVDDLIPYARNSRTHTPEQIVQIAASIREFGFTRPVLIDAENNIIAGHGSILGARKAGLDVVPAMRVDYMTDAQKRAYLIVDNQLAQNSGWDRELLSLELGELRDLGFDLDLTGFDEDELSGLLLDEETVEGLTDEDEVGEPTENPVTVLGDMWVLGNHRLMCGDSTSLDAIDQLMAGQTADLVFTSPPYGQQRDYGAAKEKVQAWDQLMSDVFSSLPVHDKSQVLVNLGLIHKDGEWVPYWDQWIDFMRQSGWKRFGLYVWDQGPGLPGDWNGRLAPAFEFIFHFCKQSRKANKTKPCVHAGEQNHGHGLRLKDGGVSDYAHIGREVQDHKIPDSVIRVIRHKARGIETEHPAVFSVALVEEIALAYSDPGEILFEPFAGSGTTAIACEKTGRDARLMELDPKYCDIAIKRWQAFTGKQATLEATGQTFDALQAERMPVEVAA